ncbi:hypothetical protein BH09BAC1_BH09BAC1_21380 [soil metagenome]
MNLISRNKHINCLHFQVEVYEQKPINYFLGSSTSTILLKSEAALITDLKPS